MCASMCVGMRSPYLELTVMSNEGARSNRGQFCVPVVFVAVSTTAVGVICAIHARQYSMHELAKLFRY